MTEQQAMRMALEALEIAADGGGVNFYEYAKELRQYLEQQPADEPVAMAWANRDGTKIVNNGKKWMHEDCVIPLYTRPQPAAWVGLTEREQGAIMEDLNAHGANLYHFAEAIETKLKEKNT